MPSRKGGVASGDDSDLEDLISKPGGGGSRSSVEIDSGRAGGPLASTPLGFVCGACTLCAYKFPRCTKCLCLLSLLAALAYVSNALFNPVRPMGIMGADYSAITSAYDLSLSKVDHWCIQGDNDSCKCEDPLEPNGRQEFKSWNAAHKANVADVQLYRAIYGSEPTRVDVDMGKPRPSLDVAFLGESVVEAMDGRWLGKRVVRAMGKGGGEGENKRRPDIGKVFERLFRKENGGPVEGVALGIAGDNTANVLWRLQHDEMPYDFNPKVWWLVLGMNDLTRMQCSEEIVVLGILRVVEEIRLRKPDAKIVINSLLPMINFQEVKSKEVQMAEFADFKRDADMKMREGMEIEEAKKKFKEEASGGRGRRYLKSKSAKEEKEHDGGGFRPERPEKRRKSKNLKKHHHGKEDDDAVDGDELEKAMERRKKILAARDKRTRDKVFKDNEKYRPKKPISPFLPMVKKRVLPPVWPAVHLINDKLREFCTKHESITFFDATPIFAADEGGGKHRLHNELISPRGHPSELGFAVWEGQIVGRLHKMLLQDKQGGMGAPVKKAVIIPAEDEGDEDPEIEQNAKNAGVVEIEPVHPTENSGDASEAIDEVKEGEGDDGVSEGKEAPKPPEVVQPSRDAPEKEGVKKTSDKPSQEEPKDEEDNAKEEEKPRKKPVKEEPDGDKGGKDKEPEKDDDDDDVKEKEEEEE